MWKQIFVEYFKQGNGSIHQEMILLGNTNNKDWFCFIKFPLGPTAEFYQCVAGLFNQPHFHLPSICFAFNIHTFLELAKRE